MEDFVAATEADPPPSAKDDNFKIRVALTNDLEVVCVAVADAVDADEDGDGEKDERGDGVRALVRCVQRAVVPGEVDGGEVLGEAGDGDGGVVPVGAVVGGERAEDALGFGCGAVAILGDGVRSGR